MCSLRGGFMEPGLSAGGGAIAAPDPIMPLNYRPKPWKSSDRWPHFGTIRRYWTANCGIPRGSGLFSVFPEPLRNSVALGILLAFGTGAACQAGRAQHAGKSKHDQHAEGEQPVNGIHRNLRGVKPDTNLYRRFETHCEVSHTPVRRTLTTWRRRAGRN